MSIASRRRALMAQKAQKEWDFEWDYTQGKLENQPGWTISTSSSTYDKTTLVSDGEKIETAANGYVQILPEVGNALRAMSNSIGVIEVVAKVYISNANTASEPQLSITGAKDGNSRVRIFCSVISNNWWWRLKDNSTTEQCSYLATFTKNTFTTIRIEMDGEYAHIYMNGNKVAKKSLSLTIEGSVNSLMSKALRGYVTIQSLKMKVGRL